MTAQGRQGTFPRPPAAGPAVRPWAVQAQVRPARPAGARAPRMRHPAGPRLRWGGLAASPRRAPAALSVPEGRPRLGSPHTPAGRPGPRRTLPVSDGAARGRCLEAPLPPPLRAQTWTGSAGAAGSRPLGRSQARRVPTPRPPPPPLLARQRAGLTGKESERETAPAAAWPVPAPRPPSPCRRERAGSAGPLARAR